MSCPNPSAHPVGVRHARETARSCSTVGSALRHVHRGPVARRSSASSADPREPGAGRARHRRRPDPRRPPLPRGRAGLGALQRRQARARRAAQRPRRRCRPTSDRQDDRLDDGPRAGRRTPSSRQYEGEGLSAVGQVVVSDDPSAFLSPALDDVGVQRHAGAALRRLRHRAEGARHPPRGDRRSAPPRSPTTREAAGRARRRRSTTKLAEAKDLLGRAQGRGARGAARRGAATTSAALRASRPPAARPPPSRYALAQVGDAYVYGAAGPSAFDCSGLTMMAWAQAGVGLPHSSSAQYRLRPARLARATCSPGDLVFYYSPISHVGIYIGNGLIVHAGQPRRRRPRRRRLLDAVLRRGPPWLTRARADRPVAPAGGWPAFRCPCSLVGGWSPRAGARPTRTCPRAPVGARPPRRDPAAATVARRLEHAGGPTVTPTTAAARGLAPAGDARGRTCWRRSSRNARALARRRLPLRYVDEDGGGWTPAAGGRPPSTPPGGSPGFDRDPARAEVTRPASRPVGERRGPDRRLRRRRPALAAVAGGPGAGPPVRRDAGGRWRARPREADRYAAAGPTRGRRRAPGAAAAGAAGWSWRCPDSQDGPRRGPGRRAGQLRRHRGGHRDRSTARRRRLPGATCFVNPEVFDRLRPRGAQVVMSHEAVHVATDAATQRAAALAARGVRRLRRAARRRPAGHHDARGQIIGQVRRDGAPAAPARSGRVRPRTTAPRGDVRERLAGLPAARRRGRRSGAGAASTAPCRREPLATALRSFGLTEAELTAPWRTGCRTSPADDWTRR